MPSILSATHFPSRRYHSTHFATMTIATTAETADGAQSPAAKTEETKQTVPFSTKAVSHIGAYPLVSESLAYVLGFQVAALIAGYVLAAVSRAAGLISSIPGLVRIFNLVDQTFDSVLSALDSRFPRLAKLSFSDVAGFVTSVLQRVVDFVKVYAGALYGRTKPYVDPAAKRVNDLYEYALNEAIPTRSSDAEVQKDTSDELGRSYILAKETYHRVEPYTRQVRAIPSHVGSVYQDEKSKAASTQEAITKTTARVSKEAYETIQPSIQKLVSVIRPEADGKSEDKVAGATVVVSAEVDGETPKEA